MNNLPDNNFCVKFHNQFLSIPIANQSGHFDCVAAAIGCKFGYCSCARKARISGIVVLALRNTSQSVMSELFSVAPYSCCPVVMESGFER